MPFYQGYIEWLFWTVVANNWLCCVSQVNWPRQTDREKTVSSQWFGHWFRHSDFVTKWGFGQDGFGDSKTCL